MPIDEVGQYRPAVAFPDRDVINDGCEEKRGKDAGGSFHARIGRWLVGVSFERRPLSKKPKLAFFRRAVDAEKKLV